MLTSQTTADDLIREFGPDLASSQPVLDELLSLCSQYSVSADVLASKWEELLFNVKQEDEADQPGGEKSSGNIPSYTQIEILRASFHREHEARVNEALGFKSGRGLVKVKMEPATQLPPSGRIFDKDSLESFLDDE
ncbi:hypothetical protein HDU67_004420, partial [Dinochytrium kinnereticum]